ncbi:MAG: glycosyltransferase family 87 protein [Gemmataceae bacterium]
MLSRAMQGLAGLVLVGCLAVAYQGLARLDRPHNDFHNHRESGRRFLAGEFLYAGGLNVPYLPAWAMVQSPLARTDAQTAYQCQAALACVAVALLLRVVHELSRRDHPLGLPSLLLLNGVVLLVFSRHIVRDLQDGGPNLLLTALAWTALWAASWPGGAMLGLAIALKLTPAVFLPWLACRRRWLFVGVTLAAAGAFTLLPAAWQGAESYRAHVVHWRDTVVGGLTRSDPSVGVLGPEEARNIALRPTLGRLLRHGLPAGEADAAVKLTMAALFAFTLWRLRRCPDTLHAGSALAVLALLLSPITWNQHAVAALPGFYLLARTALLRGGAGRVAVLLFAAFFLRNPPSIALLGEDAARQMEAWGLATASLVLLWAALLAQAADRSAASTDASTEATPIASR